MSGELVTPTGASLVRALCGMSALFRDSDQEVCTIPYSFHPFDKVECMYYIKHPRSEEEVLQAVCSLSAPQFEEELRRRVNKLTRL